MAFTAILDACVLYRAPLRDLLIRLARTNLFRARWSDQVHNEWTRSLLLKRPDLEGKLERTRDLINEAVDDCLVEGYETVIPSLALPVPDDGHVLAAAIVGRADVIVTCNLKDFSIDSLAAYNIEAQHPDTFVRHVFDLDMTVALPAVRGHRLSLKSPPKTVDEFLDILIRQDLPETVAFLRPWADLI